jgi:hypothetical protein
LNLREFEYKEKIKFDIYAFKSYNDYMNENELFEEFMKAFENIDEEKIRKEDEEWKKKTTEVSKESAEKTKQLQLKIIQRRYQREYLNESCM